MQELAAAGLPPESNVYTIDPKVIRPKGAKRICPRDGKQGAAFVDCLPNPQAGESNLMLSYGWAYEVNAIAETLDAFCTRENLCRATTYVWICCLCVNQHRVGGNVPFEVFRDTFASRVSGIGHLVAMMLPWNKPYYLTRVWCCFEMFTAQKNGCKVSIAMPAGEMQGMQLEMKHHGLARLNVLWDALKSISVEKAEASQEADREHIMNLIKSDGGYAALNARICDHLKDWLLSECQGLATAPDTHSGVLRSVATVLKHFGYVDRAIALMLQARQIREQSQKLRTEEGISVLGTLAHLYIEKGNLEGAVALCDEMINIPGVKDWPHQLSTAMFAKGRVCLLRGDNARALEEFEQAKYLRVEAQQRRPDMSIEYKLPDADLMMCTGLVKLRMGDVPGAAAELEGAKQLREELCIMGTPDGAVLLECMHDLYNAQQKYEESYQLLEDARTIRTSTDTMQTPEGARVLFGMGYILFGSFMQSPAAPGSLEKLAIAGPLFEEARQIRATTGTLDTIDGSSVLTLTGIVKVVLDKDYEAAMLDYKWAKQIMVEKKIWDTPQADGLKTCLADIKKLMQGIDPNQPEE